MGGLGREFFGVFGGVHGAWGRGVHMISMWVLNIWMNLIGLENL